MLESAVVYPRRFASLVKIEHTVFALPFAYVGAFLALDAVPSASQLVWLTLAMFGARSFAMAVNRLVDAGIDERKPRNAISRWPSSCSPSSTSTRSCAGCGRFPWRCSSSIRT